MAKIRVLIIDGDADVVLPGLPRLLTAHAYENLMRINASVFPEIAEPMTNIKLKDLGVEAFAKLLEVQNQQRIQALFGGEKQSSSSSAPGSGPSAPGSNSGPSGRVPSSGPRPTSPRSGGAQAEIPESRNQP